MLGVIEDVQRNGTKRTPSTAPAPFSADTLSGGYCSLRGMGEKPSPLGEDFSSTFVPKGFKGPRGQGFYKHV